MNEDWPDQPEMVEHMPFLTELAQRATSVIEIGVGHGNGSTRAFSRGLNANGLLICVDCDPERPQVKPTGPFRWHTVHGQSEDASTVDKVAALIADHPNPPALIFIDTEHTYEQMQKELRVWVRLADPKSTVWAFHDTWMFGAYNHMTDAIKEFAEGSPWRYVDYSKRSHGLGLLIPQRWKPGHEPFGVPEQPYE